MANRDIIVIGASAGGIEVLQQLMKALPAKFAASIFVTVHVPENATSVLPRILSRAGPLSAVHATNGEPIVSGRVYVAPPDFHLMLARTGIRLVRGARENGNRPAIDPMFRSAAIAFGPRVIGVILTGNLDDGTSGLAVIKRRGGLSVVQDPTDALCPSMPASAIEHVSVDRVVPSRHLAETLVEFSAMTLPADTQPPSHDDAMENELSAANLDAIEDPEHHPGQPSPYGCPDCGGVLWEIEEGNLTRFRCRVGHAWTADGLLGEQQHQLETALWTALRSLEESASLSRSIAERHRRRGTVELAKRFDMQGESFENRAEVVRRSLAVPMEPMKDESDKRVEAPRRVS
jgi:two-component system chemotaxis response regulator CheB